MPWLRCLVTGQLLHRSGFDPKPIYRFVVDKVALVISCPLNTAVLFKQCSILIFHSPTSDTIQS
jgi:hypothetical protein